jgi:hypothetical protein
MTLGYDQPIYILPFEHCGPFEKGRFGWKGDWAPVRHWSNDLLERAMRPDGLYRPGDMI